MSQQILIKQCRDPQRWYAEHIGEVFNTIPDPLEEKHREWRTRDRQGYLNFIQFDDGEVIDES